MLHRGPTSVRHGGDGYLGVGYRAPYGANNWMQIAEQVLVEDSGGRRESWLLLRLVIAFTPATLHLPSSLGSFNGSKLIGSAV